MERHRTGSTISQKHDAWGCGPYVNVEIQKPSIFSDIPRRYKRFGRSSTEFRDTLKAAAPFDFVLIGTAMTYWYLGIQEVINDIRLLTPNAKIILGGNYPTLCPQHARTLNIDEVVIGVETQPLWQLLKIKPDFSQPPLWECYDNLTSAVIKITDGCPFNCSYCAVSKSYPTFKKRSLSQVLCETEWLRKRGVANIAFYDDALLVKPKQILEPFLDAIIANQEKSITHCFHTPNALHVRLLNFQLANKMFLSGFKKIYLGFESSSPDWMRTTGDKAHVSELQAAIDNLVLAGFNRLDITVYVMLGHPLSTTFATEQSIRLVYNLGVRSMLAEFSPLPDTPDGEYCRKWLDLDEPLWHNKTVFSIKLLGFDETNRLKQLSHDLNRKLTKVDTPLLPPIRPGGKNKDTLG